LVTDNNQSKAMDNFAGVDVEGLNKDQLKKLMEEINLREEPVNEQNYEMQIEQCIQGMQRALGKRNARDAALRGELDSTCLF